MYITLTLNPAIDISVSCRGIAPGELNHTDSSSISCGGKGINVSRALRVMGENSTAYTLLGGETGRILAGMASREGVSLSPVRTAAPTRINIKAIDGEKQTELNGVGGPVTAAEMEELTKNMLGDAASWARNQQNVNITAVLSGSIPQGVEKSVYNSLTCMLKELGVRVAVDASGEALAEAVKARPWLIKPNRRELEGLTGTAINGFDGLVESAWKIYSETGVEVVATYGENGAVYAGSLGLWKVNAPQVVMRSFAGAGDTFLAAFLYRLRDGAADALRFAASAAAAKVCLEGTEMPATSGEMGRYVAETRAERIRE